MTASAITFSSIQWIKHRGDRLNCTENSMEAFQSAKDQGFTWLETDLRISNDGVIVLYHDQNLAISANKSLPIEDLTWSDIDKFRFSDGAKIPRIEEIWASFPEMRWTYDIKPETGLAVCEKLLKFSSEPKQKKYLTNQVKYLFWRKHHAVFLNENLGHIQMYASKTQCIRSGLAVLARFAGIGCIIPGLTYSLPPRFVGINTFKPEYVREFKKRGAHTLAYLPQGVEEHRRAVECGFDEILTDERIL
jgi:glycerophosphoryl diester phosphodiesterase